MSVRSAAPPRAGLVYGILIAAGMIAAAIGAITIGYIVYQYVWADDSFQRRNPPPVEGHAKVPAWIVQV
jgi:MFS family permease